MTVRLFVIYVSCRVFVCLCVVMLFRRAGRATDGGVAPRALTPLAFFQPELWKAARSVPLTPATAIAELQKHFDDNVSVVRHQSRSDLILVTPDFKVQGRFRPPLCVSIPPSGGAALTVGDVAQYWKENGDSSRVLVCATRRDAVGFVVVDHLGQSCDTQVARVFLAREDQATLSATRSRQSSFYANIFEHLRRYAGEIDQCSAWLYRDHGGLFSQLARNRRQLEIEQQEGTGLEVDNPAAVETVFHDRRWTPIAAARMPLGDILVHRSNQISLTAVAGCTRHGTLEIAV